jgi:hypothetical protein
VQGSAADQAAVYAGKAAVYSGKVTFLAAVIGALGSLGPAVVTAIDPAPAPAPAPQCQVQSAFPDQVAPPGYSLKQEIRTQDGKIIRFELPVPVGDSS